MIVLPQMRAVLKPHAAAAITEFVPTIKHASVSTTQSTSSTTYSSLLTFTVTTASASDVLNFVLSACGSVSVSAGNSPGFQITVDGTSIGETVVTQRSGGQTWAVTRVASVTGLSAGSHTVVLNWKSANSNAVSITPSNGVDHCVLVCRLATGSSYATLGSTLTSTASTVTDSLISTTYTSVQSSSALYIRFSAAGVNNATINAAEFKIVVDGTDVVGCAGSGDGAGFAFCAGCVAVVPVTAGLHTIAVKWAGNNSTITITDPRQHAALLVDEVNTGSPRFAKCTSDLTANSDAASCSITTPAGGVSAVLIEGTMSPQVNVSGIAQGKVVLDGTTVIQSKRGADLSSSRVDSLFMLYVGSGLSAGAHTAVLNLVSGGLSCATHPEYAHGNIVVWPVTVQP